MDDGLNGRPARDGPPAGDKTYDVFISYSRRADERLAALLQRELQRFAKPAFRRRALRVFRDDASLSANPGLWSSIEQALDTSRYLVLLASPEAATSPWVAREIEHWRATEPPDRLLLVVTDGDVAWDDGIRDFDLRRSTAIPPALAGFFAEEPRFVDLRADGQGSTLDPGDRRLAAAIADLAAPVHGRSKDDLVGEDLRQHRRLVRLTRTAAIVLTVLLVASVIGGVGAVVQRNEALTQRRRAETAAEEARKAAADSEFRRLANAASTAPTSPDAVALAIGALAAADDAGREERSAIRPLLTALSRADLPLLRFAGQSPGQGSSGERHGVDASLDGTALAFIGNDGDINVWDLTLLDERVIIPGEEVGGRADQLALWPDGSRLVVLAYPPTAILNGEDPTDSVVSIYDLDAGAASLRFTGIVPVVSSSAVAFGPDDETVLIIEEQGTLMVARQDGSGFTSTRVGEPIFVPNAGVMISGFSVDGRRACSKGEGVLQVYAVDPPERIAVVPEPDVPPDRVGVPLEPDPLRTGNACLPEPCGGSPASFAVTAKDGWLRCLEPDGADVTLEVDSPAHLRSVAYSGLVDFSRVGAFNGWSVRPALYDMGLPLADFELSPDASAWSARQFNESGLIGARLVRAGPGVGLLTADNDGLIQLWSPSSGALEPSAVDEIGDADVRLSPIPGPPGVAGSYASAVDEADPALPTQIFDVRSGQLVSGWEHTAAPRLPDARGAPVALRALDEDRIIELLDDGTLVIHHLASGNTDERVLPLSAPLAADRVDLSAERIAVVDGTTGIVANLTDGSTLARFELAAEVCGDPIFPNETSFVDLSEDGDSLAIVSCPPEGRSLVQFSAGIGGAQPALETVELRYPFPTSVSVADGARTVAVAFSFGQVGVRRDDRWIEPDALKAERAGHNMYQRGWAAVDPEGQLLVTRRDGLDVELWTIDGGAVDRVARLTHDAQPPPPRWRSSRRPQRP